MEFTDAFPSGFLRVLAVDNDRVWLKILEKMLNDCSYKVTTFCLARDALNMLREGKHNFDIVITDANMPDIDGFQLLEHVRIEMDFPVIMMSIDGEVSRVMKAVQHGACDYLLKTTPMRQLQNLWQHVIRKKLQKGENIQMMIRGSDEIHNGYKENAGETNAARKRKDMEESESVDPTTRKKARVVWSEELHQKFMEATIQLGSHNAKPKKILDLMNVPGLTREHVASHLQKYRLSLLKLRTENEVKTYTGIKQRDFSHHVGSFGFQTSTLMHSHPRAAADCDPECRDNNMLLIVDPQSSPHAVGLGTPVVDNNKAYNVKIAPFCSQSGRNHGQTPNLAISDAFSSFNVGTQNQMVKVNSFNECEPAEHSLFATGDSLLESPGECASSETIGVLDMGLFNNSGAELSAEPGETYCWRNLEFEWDWLQELLAEGEETC